MNQDDYDGAVGGNGDWASWKRLLVGQISELKAAQRELEAAKNRHITEMAVLKTKIAMYSAIIAILSSGAANWVLRNLG